MKYKVVADSSCDLNTELLESVNIQTVPLTIYLDEKEMVDDETLNVKDLLISMKDSKNAPRTASPSPHQFTQAYQGSESIFVVTLSSKLSSTYQNAVLAKEMIKDEGDNKFIHVFDSLSASVGETLVGLKIGELAKQNHKDWEIVEKVNEYIREMRTFFLLESLDHLIKAGRISKVIGKLSSVLSMKLIMRGDEGSIKLQEKVRGAQKAFRRFVETVGEQGERLEEKVLGIAHCNCLEKALEFKEEIEKRFTFKKIIIVEMAGLSSIYADDGGIVIAF